MIRALIVALIASGCAKERGAVVGTSDDPMSVIAGELLHAELATRPEGARRKRCGEIIDCLAELRAGAVDVLVLERDQLSWLVPEGELDVIAELPVERRFVLAGTRIASTGELAALGRPARVAVSPPFAGRARGGLAELDARPGLEIEPLLIADPGERSSLLEAGVVDAAVFEAWRRPPDSRELLALAGSRYVVVAGERILARGRDSVARATGAVVVRLEKLAGRILAAVGGGLEPLEAVKLLAPRQRGPAAPLVLAVSGAHRAWSPLVERALASRSVTPRESPRARQAIAGGAATLALVEPGAAVEGAELIAVFAGRGRPDAELWARTGALDLADARRVLAASPLARMPGDQRPTLWRRVTASARRPPARGSSRWFDTLVNLLVGTFLVWLVVSIVRRPS